jgi:hypothetical protein
MKMKIASLTLIWGTFSLLCIAMASSVHAQAPAPTFEVKYIIPLSTGDITNYEVIDSANAARTNMAQLRPAIIRLLDAMQAGTMPSHPTADGLDSENNPKTFYRRVSDAFDKRGQGPISTASLCASIDCIFTGKISDGHAVLTLKSIDFVHIPPGDDMMSYVLFSAQPEELDAYKIGKKPLKAYLESRKYESYINWVSVNGINTSINDLDDAVRFQKKLDKGDLSGF